MTERDDLSLWTSQQMRDAVEERVLAWGFGSRDAERIAEYVTSDTVLCESLLPATPGSSATTGSLILALLEARARLREFAREFAWEDDL